MNGWEEKEEEGEEGTEEAPPASIDVRTVREIPVKVAACVDPVVGASVRVPSQLEPPEMGRLNIHHLFLMTWFAFWVNQLKCKKVCWWHTTSFYDIHLVVQSSSSLDRSLREALCFSSSRSFSWLAASVRKSEVIRAVQVQRLKRRCMTTWYLCLRSPSLWCPAWADNQSVAAASPSQAPVHLVSLQSW